MGLPITGFATSGNNLVAGTYNMILSEAYIYISFDNGLNWSIDTAFQVFNKLPFLPHYLGTPVTFFTYDGYVFAGIGGAYRGAIYRSSDHGITWSSNGILWPEADSNSTEDINCFTNSGKTIFTGTNHGVFLSTDNGITWIASNNGMPVITSGSYSYAPQVFSLVTQGSNIFAGTGLGIFHSSNNGSTWLATDNGIATTSLVINGLAIIGSTVFAGIYNDNTTYTGGVFSSTNQGSNWNEVDNGLTDRRINVLATNGINLLVVGTNSGLFQSINSGETWNRVTTRTIIDSVYTRTIAIIDSKLFIGTQESGAWYFPLSQ